MKKSNKSSIWFGELFDNLICLFGVPIWRAFRIRNKLLSFFGGEIKDSSKALVLCREEIIHFKKGVCMNFDVKIGSVIFHSTKSCALYSKIDYLTGEKDKNTMTFELHFVEK